MNQREAMRRACRITARLIESYFDVGQPHHDVMDGGESMEDADRLYNALDTLKCQLERRGGIYDEAERSSEKGSQGA